MSGGFVFVSTGGINQSATGRNSTCCPGGWAAGRVWKTQIASGLPKKSLDERSLYWATGDAHRFCALSNEAVTATCSLPPNPAIPQAAKLPQSLTRHFQCLFKYTSVSPKSGLTP